MKVRQQPGEHAQKLASQNNVLAIFENFLVTVQNQFSISTSPNINSLLLENHLKKLNKYIQVTSNHNMQRIRDAGIPPPKLRLLA
jgi:hypothetical protein